MFESDIHIIAYLGSLAEGYDLDAKTYAKIMPRLLRPPCQLMG